MIPNMTTWAEIHTHFAEGDQRIPPFHCYIDEEKGPHLDNTLLAFRPKDGADVQDTTGAFGRAAGGVSPKGNILPPIMFPRPSIDTSKGKIAGGAKGPLKKPGDSDSDTDSMEHEEGDEDFDKLHELAHAVTREQPVTVEIRGGCPWNGRFELVVFAREFKKQPKPNHILEPMQAVFQAIKKLSVYYQRTDIPQSCLWTNAGLPREEAEMRVTKKGARVHLSFGYRGSFALDMANARSRFRVELIEGWSITFRTSETPPE
jgi:hypothetical protein